MNFKDMIRSGAEPGGQSGERKKPNMVLIWIIIGALVFLAFGGMGNSEKESEADVEASDYSEEYVRGEEKRLEQILKKINGAGDVSVYISMDSGGEKVLARDSKSKLSEESESTKGNARQEESESLVVMSGKGSAGEPYVVKERLPEVAGVLVVAKGAADARVRQEIYEAVKAVYGMSAHRIRVAY